MEVIAGFRVWQLAFMSAFALLCLVIVLCCIFRCRIPRTKQEIEADCARKKVTKQFSQHLRKIPVDKMELENVLPEVITLEHHRVLKGIKEEKMTFFQKLKKALLSKEDDESSSSGLGDDDIEAGEKDADDSTKDASGEKTPGEKGSIKDPDDITLEEVIGDSKPKTAHQEQLLGAIKKLNRIRAVQQQLQSFAKLKDEDTHEKSPEKSSAPDQSLTRQASSSSPAKQSRSSSKHASRHPSKEKKSTEKSEEKSGDADDRESTPKKKKVTSKESLKEKGREESVTPREWKSRQRSRGETREESGTSKKTSGHDLKTEEKEEDKKKKDKKRKKSPGDDKILVEEKSHSLDSSIHPLSHRHHHHPGDGKDSGSGGSGSSKAAFLSKQRTDPILDPSEILRKDLTYSTFKQPTQQQKHHHHQRTKQSEDLDIDTLKQIKEKREKRMSRQIELTDQDIQVISGLHPPSRRQQHSSSTQTSLHRPLPPSPTFTRATQYPPDAALYEEIGPPRSRLTSRPPSLEIPQPPQQRQSRQRSSRDQRREEESKSGDIEEERTKF